MKRLFVFIIIGYMLAGSWAGAADEPVQANGDKIWGDTKKDLTYIEGNVRIVQGVTIITTDKVKVDTGKKTAYFEDKVTLSNSDLTINAAKLEYNFKKKNGIFSTQVILNRAAVKNEWGKTVKDAFKLMTEQLYFESDSKNFIAKNKGRVEHHEFSGDADRIEYNDTKQELLFVGNASLKRPKGEEIKGDLITLNIVDKSFIVNKNVTINIKVEEDSHSKE